MAAKRTQHSTSSTPDAGVRRRRSALPKGARITGAERESVSARIREQYLAGASIRTLAGDLGRSYGFVHRILVDGKVPLRGRGGAVRRKVT